MSLRLRLLFIFSALIIVTIAVFAALLYTTMQRSLQTEMDRRLHVRASQVELTIWPGTTSLTAQDIVASKLDLSPLAELDAPGVYVQVLDRTGQVVARSSNLGTAQLPVPINAVTGAVDRHTTLTTTSVGAERSVRILSQPILSNGTVIGVLEVGQSRQPLTQTLDDLRTLLLLVGTALLAVGAGSVWLATWRGLRPLNAISRRAAQIAAAQAFSERLPYARRRDEIGQLARTINDLLATVDGLLQQHRTFVADTSHELRNPLLALRTDLDVLERVDDQAIRRECLQEAREQTDRMTRLVSDLLLLARAEAVQLIAWQPVALAPLLDHIADAARKWAGNRTISVTTAEDLCVQGDAGRLTQVVTNLVANAVEHTAPDGTIMLALSRNEGRARIDVRDNGAGIAAENLPHLFDRFFRAEQHGRVGTGLGLAIVKHLTEAHGGQVTVESTPGRGSCFTVWLPLHGGTEAARPAPPRARVVA